MTLWLFCESWFNFPICIWRSCSGPKESTRNFCSSPRRTFCGVFWCQLSYMPFWEHAGNTRYAMPTLYVHLESFKPLLFIITFQHHSWRVLWLSFDHSQNPAEQATFHDERWGVLWEDEVLHPTNSAPEEGNELCRNHWMDFIWSQTNNLSFNLHFYWNESVFISFFVRSFTSMAWVCLNWIILLSSR